MTPATINGLGSRSLTSALTFVSLLWCGCGCDDDPAGNVTDDSAVDGSLADAVVDVMSPDASIVDASLGQPCSSSAQCASGLCTSGSGEDGVCCDDEVNVCGNSCCGTDDACFGGSCVQPGAICRLERDCGDAEYCEYALGDGNDSKDNQCSVLAQGRCLALPPSCSDVDGGELCIADPGVCEYRPPVGDLDAVVQWFWDDTNATLPDKVDVWSTPMVGRVTDTDCDDDVDGADIPSVVFVSGHVLVDKDDPNSGVNCNNNNVDSCTSGVLRVLAGDDGRELLSLESIEGSSGFAASTVGLADMDRDGVLDIVALTAERRVAVLSGRGELLMLSDVQVPSHGEFGWGGGVAIADIDQDGLAEVTFGGAVYTTKDAGGNPPAEPGVLKHLWTTAANHSGRSLDFFADVAATPGLELVTSQNVYDSSGNALWNQNRSFGFAAIADLDNNGTPELVVVTGGKVHVLDAADGSDLYTEFTLGNAGGSGGPPTLADFDGDGFVEIGIAQKENYFLLKPDTEKKELVQAWAAPNHDLSSSVTGSTVFDFQGDGAAEVIYNDECYLWVYDGTTGEVRFAAPTKSFTATESNVVADVDADGHAEMLWVANQVKNNNNGSWDCEDEGWTEADPVTKRPAWTRAPDGNFWRGVRVYRDAANSWVGTRQVWNQHAYSVTNICTGEDTACGNGSGYGQVPSVQLNNWEQPWANNFRQNIQESGVFDAADAALSLDIPCRGTSIKVTLRNQGRATLPAGVQVDVTRDGNAAVIASRVSETALLPGRVLEFELEVGSIETGDSFTATIVNNGGFTECRTDNNTRGPEEARGCLR